MRERLRNEARRYAELNNEEWGHVAGVLFGIGTGIYITLNYTSRELIGDLFISLLVKGCTIPVSAGFFSLMFSKAGAGVDVLTNKKTLVTVARDKIMGCCNRRRDRIAQSLFFSDGIPYSRSAPRSGTELILRHEKSGESSDIVIQGSGMGDSPRDLEAATSPEIGTSLDEEENNAGYQGGYMPGLKRGE